MINQAFIYSIVNSTQESSGIIPPLVDPSCVLPSARPVNPSPIKNEIQLHSGSKQQNININKIEIIRLNLSGHWNTVVSIRLQSEMGISCLKVVRTTVIAGTVDGRQSE
jgi:hypothetical protein